MKYIKTDSNLISWLKVMRISQGFFLITAMPITLGVLLFLYHNDVSFLNLQQSFTVIFVMLGGLCFHVGADMINEYYDHISGNDALVIHKTPFSGGTRVLEEKKLCPLAVLRVSYIFFAIAFLFSLIAASLSTYNLLYFSLLGFISCWGYSSPPLKFCYRSLGELIIFLNNGLFVIGAVYYSLSFQLSTNYIFTSCFLGFLGASIILMNQIPDYEADKKVKKNNWIVRLGKDKGLILQQAMIMLAFLALLIAIIRKEIPLICLATFLVFFFFPTKKLFNYSQRNLSDTTYLKQSCHRTIKLKFASFIFLASSFIIHLIFIK